MKEAGVGDSGLGTREKKQPDLRTAIENIIGRIEKHQNIDPDCLDDQERLNCAEYTIIDVMRLATEALKEKA